MGWWLGVRSKDKTGVLVGMLTQEFPRLVLSQVFQSTCSSLRSPAVKTDNLPPKQVYRSARISGRKGENRPQGFSPVCRPM
jgi:hypothetical protein